MTRITISSIFLLVATLWHFDSFAQCQLQDGNGNPSSNPIYIGCSQVTSANDTDFVLVINPSNNFGSWTMNWGDGQTSNGTSLNPPAFITHTYTSVTNGGTVFADTFIFTFTSGSCTITGTVVSGYPVTANIEVPGGLTQLTCAPGTLSFINNSNGASGLPITPGTVFTWDWGDGSPLETYGYQHAGDTISHTYQKGDVTCITQVDLTANNACNLSPSVNSQSPVLIYDIDDAAIAASATVLCYPDTVVNFANGSYFNCVPQGNTDQRYEYWNFGDYWGKGYDSIVDWRPSGAPLGTPAPNPIPIAFPGIGSYTVNMIDSNFCGQDPASIVIQIVPPPTAGLDGPDTVCVGEQVQFQNLSTGGANYFRWNFDDGNGFVAIGGGNQTYTYNMPGTYNVRLAIGISGSNCVDTVELTVEVLPTPTAFISLDNSVGCDSLSVTFSDSSIGGAIAWNWNFGNGQTSTAQNPGLQFYGTTNNYNASLKVTNVFGCADSTVKVINVFQTPVPNFSPQNVCVNEVSQFNDSSQHAVGDPIVSWSWDFGDGSPINTQQNPNHTYASAGSYNVILSVATANCAAQDTIVVVVEQLPISAFSMDTTKGCSPLTVNFSNNSSANATNFVWNFGNGDNSTQTNPQYTFINNYGVDTTFNVELVALTAFGCSDTSALPVEVYPNPIALFTDSAPPINCTPAVIAFRNLSYAGAVSYLWQLDGKTSTLTHPRDTFVNNTNFLDTAFVQLIAFSANGCTDTSSKDYLIFPSPTEIPALIDSGCKQLQVTFPAVVNAVSYNWNFGDGNVSSLPTPTNTYVAQGNYTVTLVSTSAVGCQTTSQGLVKVYDRPQAFYTHVPPFGCSPLSVDLTSQSPGATMYHWDFDDGSTLDTNDTAAAHVFINTMDTTQIFDVKLKVENSFGCMDSVVNSVLVYPQLTASFEHDTGACSPFGAIFTNTSSPSATIFGWHFGDGGTSPNKNPAHTYIVSGKTPETYIVSLVAASINGCRDSVASQLTVYPRPNAAFTVDPPTKSLTYPDTVFGLNNLDLNWQYIWDFGDGNTSTDSIPGNHAYTGWGEFTIQLIAYNEFCQDSTSEEVIILPPVPIVDFGDSTEGCEDLTVQFISKAKYANTYKWEFVNAVTNSKQTSSDKDPEITFTDPGTYNVVLYVTGDGGESDKTKFGYITVYEQPTAAFTFAPEEITIPNQAVVFFNNSRGDNLTYSWNFGDGNTSSVQSPEHYYTAEGEYYISLIASNPLCSDTFTSEVPVTALPSGSVVTPNAFTPRTDGDPGTDGGYDINSAGHCRSCNDVFYPKITGQIKEYEFMIFNKWGELLFRTTRQSVGWTGWYRNRLCQQDVYVYKVKATLIDNSVEVQAGDVTLLR